MNEILIEIGKKIKMYRKKQKMTLDDLSKVIFKSKATVSKYENGEISIDIETLYDIAKALSINVEQLLYTPVNKSEMSDTSKIPLFFRGLSTFYGYWFDGRNNSILRMRFDVSPSEDINQQKLIMYMNLRTSFIRWWKMKLCFGLTTIHNL